MTAGQGLAQSTAWSLARLRRKSPPAFRGGGGWQCHGDTALMLCHGGTALFNGAPSPAPGLGHQSHPLEHLFTVPALKLQAQQQHFVFALHFCLVFHIYSITMKYEGAKGKVATIERPEKSKFCTESKAKGPILLMKQLSCFSAECKERAGAVWLLCAISLPSIMF